MQERLARSANRRRAATLAAVVLATGAVAGCATTGLDAQWTDPQFQGRSLRGSTILVVCEALDVATRRLCQDRLAAEVVAYGATPSLAPDIANPVPGREQATSAYLPAARAAGAQAVFSAAMQSEALPRGYGGPSVGIGVGGFGGGRVGVGGGIGISLPIGGGGGPAYRQGLSGALTDVASGKLMWSGTASTAESTDLGAQLTELARAVAQGAQEAGFF